MADINSQQAQTQNLLRQHFVPNSIDAFGRPLDKLLPIYLQKVKTEKEKSRKTFSAFFVKSVEDLPFLVQLLNKQAGDKNTYAEFFVRSRTANSQHVVLVHYQKIDGKYNFAIMEPAYKTPGADKNYPSAVLTNSIIKAIKQGFSEKDYNEKTDIHVLTNHVQKSLKGCVEIALVTAEEAALNPTEFTNTISKKHSNFSNAQLDDHKQKEETAITDKNIFSINLQSLPDVFGEIKQDNKVWAALPNDFIQSERKKIAKALPDNDSINSIPDLKTTLNNRTGITLLEKNGDGMLPPYLKSIEVNDTKTFIAIETNTKYPELAEAFQTMFPERVKCAENKIYLPTSITPEQLVEAQAKIPNYSTALAGCEAFAIKNYNNRNDMINDFKQVYQNLYSNNVPKVILDLVTGIVNSPQGEETAMATDGASMPYNNAVIFSKFLLPKIKEISSHKDMHPDNNLTMRATLSILEKTLVKSKEPSLNIA